MPRGESMIRVAVLDDDVDILEMMGGLLRGKGFEVTTFERGKDLIRGVQRDGNGFELFILDWNVPDFSGIHVLEWLRNKLGSRIPILLLTNRGNDDDIVTGLRAGADDFVIKPCKPVVLLARIEALLRRSSAGGAQGAIEHYGRYALNLTNRTVAVDGLEPVLTPKEFSLILLLFRHLNRAVARAYIMETVWGIDPDVLTRTLDIHVSRVRTKLGLGSESGYRLSTIYGYGYRLEEVFT